MKTFKEIRLSILEKEYPGKGPCLVPKQGRSGITSHEKDFCECDMVDFWDSCDRLHREAAQGLIDALRFVGNSQELIDSTYDQISKALEAYRKKLE